MVAFCELAWSWWAAEANLSSERVSLVAHATADPLLSIFKL
jgi:hypothetical protein